jgi:O-antigen/teichoic acid export membrane protein
MEKKDHLIKDSFVLFVATTVVNISNFVFHMYVTRKLGPEGYGALATVLAMLVIVSMPSLALQMTITKKTSMFKANGKYGSIENLFKKATKWALMLGLAYFVLFVVGAGWIQSFFNIEDKMLIYILGLIAIVSLLTPVVRGVLQGLQNFIGFGFNLAIDAILRLTFVVLFIWLGWGVRCALSTTLFSPMCAFVIGVLMMSFIFKYK